MFNISTKADYALIIMMELAKHEKLGYLTLSAISKKLKLSSPYLTQIAQPLIKSGLIESREGKGGGLKLARKSGSISVLDIVEIVEGEVELRCFQVGRKKCTSIKCCSVKSVWVGIINDVRSLLSKKKLSNLVKK